MPIISARIGPVNRKRIDSLSRTMHKGNAETLRTLIVLGLGGSLTAAEGLNEDMSRKREAAEAFHGRERQPGPREAARKDGVHSPVVAVRLPAHWIRKVNAQGGLRAVLEYGLGKV